MDDLTGLGATGIFIIYLLKTVLPFIIPSMKQDNSALIEIVSILKQIQLPVDDLHEWCSVRDQDGVKLIYVRRSMIEALQRTAEGINKVAIVLDRLQQGQGRIEGEIQIIGREVQKIQKE